MNDNINYLNPKISIITVCFNSEKTISKTIESVLQQNYDNYEYIIIDGKSTDNTMAIVKKYSEKFSERMKYISEKDTGIYNAMNKGIKMCTGDIIGIINSDDYYGKDTLKFVAQTYFQEKYPLIVINGDMERIDEKGNEIYRYRFTNQMIKEKKCFGHPAMFVAKKVYDEVGLYNENYILAADGEWQYRVHERADIKYILVNKVFTYMREGGASDNPQYKWDWFKERVRMKLEHKKGNMVEIYLQELLSVIRTIIKGIIPSKWSRFFYKMKYRK